MVARTAFGKYLDPVRIYDSAPQLWDFVLLTLILFYVIKRAFLTAHAMRTKALGTSSTDEHKKTDNVLSFLIALVMSIGLMRFGKVSMQFAFTSGVLPGFAALMLGFGAYSVLLGMMGKERWPIAMGLASIVAIGLFAALRSAAGGDYEWMYMLFWFVGIMIFVSMAKGFESKGADSGTTLSTTSADVADAIKSAAKFGKDLVDVKKTTEKAVKKTEGLIEKLTKVIGKMGESIEKVKASLSTASLVATAVGVLASMGTASAEEKKKELSKTYPTEVVEEAMKIVEALPKAAAAPAKPGAPPAEEPVIIITEEIPLGPATSAKVKEIVDIDIPAIESAVREIEEYFKLMEDIPVSLAKIPPDVQTLIARNKTIQKDLSDLGKNAEIVVKHASQSGLEPFKPKADKLRADVIRLSESAARINQQIDESTRPLSSLLSGKGVETLSRELDKKLVKIKESFDLLKKRAKTLKMKGAGKPDLERFEKVLENLCNLFIEVDAVLKHHGDVDTLLTGLTGFTSIVGNLPNVLQGFEDEIKPLKDEWRLLMMEMQDEERKAKEKKVELEKAEFTATIETEQIKKDIQTLDSLVTGLVRPGKVPVQDQSLSKNDVGPFNDNATLALQILGKLELERRKLVSLPTHSKATDALGKLLQTLLRGINLRTDLVRFVNSCEDAGKAADDAAAGKILKDAILKFQTVQVEGESYDDYLGGLTRAIITTAGNVSKEIASSPEIALHG